MFKVGDTVYINPSSALKWVDEKQKLLQEGGPFTIREIVTEDTAVSWQTRYGKNLFILLQEPNWWVNVNCLVYEKDYKVNAIERKIAHLYKLFDERKKNVESN